MLKKIILIKDKVKNYLVKKEEEYTQKVDRRESFVCPYCEELHKSSYYYKNKAREKDIKEKTKGNCKKSINFIRCKKCGKLFGVENSRYFEPTPVLFRSSFKVED